MGGDKDPTEEEESGADDGPEFPPPELGSAVPLEEKIDMRLAGCVGDSVNG